MPNLDVRTMLVLLVFGHLVSALLIALRDVVRDRTLQRRFLLGRLLQALAWLLLSLRGRVPDLASAHLGNGFLLAGFALEAAALVSTTPGGQIWSSRLGLLAGTGILAFWTLGKNPALWVGISSLATVAILGVTTFVLLQERGRSRLRLSLGCLYGGFSLVLAARGILGLLPGSTISLMHPGLIQNLAFLPLFILLVAGGTGFTLLLEAREEALLGESEARFLAIFRLCPAPLLITRLRDGVIQDCNEALLALGDYDRAALVGSSVLELGFYEDAETRARLLAELTREGILEGRELRLHSPLGKVREVLLSAVTLRVGGEAFILSVIQDITRRKLEAADRERMIRDLQEALARVRTLSGLLPICSNCKKIRDDSGHWDQVEHYVATRTDAGFTHGLCPDCAKLFFPGRKQEG